MFKKCLTFLFVDFHRPEPFSSLPGYKDPNGAAFSGRQFAFLRVNNTLLLLLRPSLSTDTPDLNRRPHSQNFPPSLRYVELHWWKTAGTALKIFVNQTIFAFICSGWMGFFNMRESFRKTAVSWSHFSDSFRNRLATRYLHLKVSLSLRIHLHALTSALKSKTAVYLCKLRSFNWSATEREHTSNIPIIPAWTTSSGRNSRSSTVHLNEKACYRVLLWYKFTRLSLILSKDVLFGNASSVHSRKDKTLKVCLQVGRTETCCRVFSFTGVVRTSLREATVRQTVGRRRTHLLSTPPSSDALRHSGGERRRCTSATVTLYLDVELSSDRRPGTEQKTSDGADTPEITMSFWSGFRMPGTRDDKDDVENQRFKSVKRGPTTRSFVCSRNLASTRCSFSVRKLHMFLYASEAIWKSSEETGEDLLKIVQPSYSFLLRKTLRSKWGKQWALEKWVRLFLQRIGFHCVIHSWNRSCASGLAETRDPNILPLRFKVN